MNDIARILIEAVGYGSIFHSIITDRQNSLLEVCATCDKLGFPKVSAILRQASGSLEPLRELAAAADARIRELEKEVAELSAQGREKSDG